MKFSVSSSDLLSKLSLEIGAISSNPVLPILEDFLFKAEGETLTIAATNLETTIITSLPVNVEEGGQIAIPAKIAPRTNCTGIINSNGGILSP